MRQTGYDGDGIERHGGRESLCWLLTAWTVGSSVNGVEHVPEHFHGQPSGVLPESQMRFNDTLGAQLIEASATSLMSRFYDIKGNLIDEFTLEH